MATQETVKQITQGGVTRDVEDTTARQGLASKVDKNGTDSLMTAAEHTKLGNLPTATELATQMNAKANDNAVVKSISVNGQTPQTPQNGNVDISVEGAAGEDGITPHIGSNGNWWIGPETYPSNDTNVKAQGPMGSVTITDGSINSLEVHNALNAYTGLLGMGGAMRIKSNIDSLYASLNRLYGKLANMAFWDSEDQEDAAPTPVDWSIPQITVTLDKTNLSANAMITNASDQEITGTSVLVDEGSGLTLKIKPKPGYAITGSPSVAIGGVSQTLTESNGVYTLVIDSVTEAITIAISATAAQARSVTLNLTGCTKVSGPTGIADGEGGTFVFAADTDYTLPTAAPTVVGASIATNGWDSTTGTLVISNVSGDVTITIAATYTGWIAISKADTADKYGIQQGFSINPTSMINTAGVTNSLPTVVIVPKCNPTTTSINTSSPILAEGVGNSERYFFPTGGKQYLNVRITDNNLGADKYKIAVACYKVGIVDGYTYSQAEVTQRGITRINYTEGNPDNGVTVWKYDLFAALTNPTCTGAGSSLQNGDIKYIKLLITRASGQDTQDWVDNISIDYKMTDD